jgi:hypothetical protein
MDTKIFGFYHSSQGGRRFGEGGGGGAIPQVLGIPTVKKSSARSSRESGRGNLRFTRYLVFSDIPSFLPVGKFFIFVYKLVQKAKF